jgi:hypothetical protein
MRKFALFLIIGGLGALYLLQKQHEQDSQAARPRAAQVATAPREPSEHNWMKRSLDTTRKVTGQVRQQRKEDGVRD